MVGRMRKPARILPWLVASAALAVTLAACGGGDDDDVASGATFSTGGIDCAAMNNDSHRYVTTYTFRVEAAPTPTPEGVPGAPPPTEVTLKVEVSVESADAQQALYTYEDEFNHNETDIIAVGDQYFQKSGSDPWRLSEGGSIPYQAISICGALAPDMDLASTEHETEEVNGIQSERFDYTDWATEWAVRFPSFGGGSDVGTLIETWTGSVWVAHDGNYISKVHLTGQGAYPDGSPLHVEFAYEIMDRGDDVNVEAPL